MYLEIDFSEKDITQFIASLNSSSEHPLAEATVKYGKEQKVEILKADNFSAVTGKGVEGKVNGKKVELGNAKMMEYAIAIVSVRHGKRSAILSEAR